MIRYLSLSQEKEWSEVLSYIPSCDIYYTPGYCKAFSIHGDGEPVLVVYDGNEGVIGVCVLMIRDIGSHSYFNNKLKSGAYYDATTPYGYGGFIFNQNLSIEELLIVKKEFEAALLQRNIISVFFRLHPILDNVRYSSILCETKELGKTIGIDLSSSDTIWANITSKNRNMIRKAQKYGIEVRHGNSEELLAEFKKIYNRTMDDDNASPYYYFKDEFYRSIYLDLANNHEIFYAVSNGQIISMAIMLLYRDKMHYHLSGSLREWRHMAPSNLLLYSASLWGAEHGFSIFHLGGGLGGANDNLFKFKASFNRNSDFTFAIGRMIVDQQKYWELAGMRGYTADSDETFFPVYRL